MSRKTPRQIAAEREQAQRVSADTAAPVAPAVAATADDEDIDLVAIAKAIIRDPETSPRQRLLALQELRALGHGTTGIERIELQPGQTCERCGHHVNTPEEHQAIIERIVGKWVYATPADESADESSADLADDRVAPAGVWARGKAIEEADDYFPHEPEPEQIIEREETAAERLLRIEAKLEKGDGLTRDEAAEYLHAKGHR